MPDVDTKTVALSRKKFPLISVLSLAFVMPGFWLFTLGDATIQDGQRLRSPSIVHGVGALSVDLSSIINRVD